MICVFINMTGTPEGSTESGFMEKPGIEPATPGLLLNNSFVVSHDVNPQTDRLQCKRMFI